MVAALADLRVSTRLLQHVFRRHRHRVALDLATAITAALEQRTPLTWWRLFSFMFQSSLPEPTDPPSSRETTAQNNPRSATRADVDALSKRIQRKCVDGDIRAVLRLLTTSNSVIFPIEEVVEVLRDKHPNAASGEEYPELPDSDQHRLTITEVDVMTAIQATSPDSAAGLDGLRPTHLRQLVARYIAEADQRLHIPEEAR